MIVKTPSKIVLVLLVSLFGLGLGSSAVLAEAENSSVSPQGSSRTCQTIQGVPLAQSSTMSANPAHGRLRPDYAHPRIPATRSISPGIGRNLTAPRSLRGPLARLPRSTAPPNRVSQPITPPSNHPVSGNTTDRILSQARHYLGTPYRSGGSLETGRATDCSGFVQHVYQKSNIDLPRSSSEQAREGKAVAYTLDFAKMQPGDLLFFGRKGRHINHVGIYAGDGKMIHASSSCRRVVISDLSQPNLEGSFVVAKRLPEVQPPK